MVRSGGQSLRRVAVCYMGCVLQRRFASCGVLWLGYVLCLLVFAFWHVWCIYWFAWMTQA